MVRMTAELITTTGAFVNTLADRELDLRGLRISAIENLGATFDQFDTINLTDNEIRQVGNFPLLLRLKTLIIANNKVSSVDSNLFSCLPNLDTLVLTNNSVTSTEILDSLSSCLSLIHLVLINNPVCKLPEYRLHAIARIPNLRVLDYCRITDKERHAAKSLIQADFQNNTNNNNYQVPSTSVGEMKNNGTTEGEEIFEESTSNNQVKKSPNTTTNNNNSDDDNNDVDDSLLKENNVSKRSSSSYTSSAVGLTEAERQKIMTAIKNAKNLNEIQRLEEQLNRGSFLSGAVVKKT